MKKIKNYLIIFEELPISIRELSCNFGKEKGNGVFQMVSQRAGLGFFCVTESLTIF